MNVPKPEYIDFPGSRTVVVRFSELPVSRMPEAMDRAYRALGEAMQQGAFRPAGPAFSRYESVPGETATFETGFPVEDPLAEAMTVGDVRIVPSELPACTLAISQHVGPYEGLGESWRSFVDQVESAGRTTLMPFWEAYDTEPGPDVDPETLITELAVPVKDDPNTA